MTQKKKALLSENMRRRIRRSPAFSTFLFLVILYAAVSVFRPAFFTLNNFYTIMLAAMITIMVGFGQMATMAMNGMNLSLGGIGGFCAVFCGALMERYGFATWQAVGIGLAIGIVAGLLNGGLAALLGATGLMTWLITLGTSYIFYGLQSAVNNSLTFSNLNESFNYFGTLKFLGMPFLMYIMLATAVLLFLFYRFTGMGVRTLAVGANPEAARFSGINVSKTLIVSHMLSGFLAAMAGIMLSARLTVASADIGKEWGFYSFAAPVIGGVVGGRVSIVGTLIGGFLLATIETAIVHFGLDMNFNTLVKGGVIIIAVAVNAFRQTRMEKEK